jgi:3-dehydroquinate synthase
MKKRNKSGCYRQSFSVRFDYPVLFTHGLFRPGNDLLVKVVGRRNEGRRHRVMVYVDSGVVGAHPGVISDIQAYFAAHAHIIELKGSIEIVPGGERAKNGWDNVRDVMTAIGRQHLCRQSFVLVIGGGAVLDMVGFAASLVHRGLRLIRVPTTVLAQNDAGVGVKNGMNEHGAKNFVGTFAPPFAVIDDFDFLRTLDDRDWAGGIAEAFKVAIIKDAGFLSFLCRNVRRLRERDMAAMEELVERCARLHLDHIREGGDPFEFGSARPLDFGHWSAHKVEVMSHHALGHGQAVALGIALDTYYAMKKKHITRRDLTRIFRGMADCGLPLWDDALQLRNGGGKLQILDGLNQFKEHLGGELTITLPDPVGRRREIHEVEPAIIEEAVVFLKNYARTH